jgi:foldase protein PrsA
MRIRQIFAGAGIISLSVFVATGCSLGGGVPSDAVCTVNGESVAQKKFDQIINQARRNYTSQGQKFPKKSSTEYKNLRNQGVDFLIEQELFKQEADKLKVKVSKKAVDDRLKQLKESFFKGDDKAYQKELKKQGLTEKQVRENLEQQLLSEKLFEKVTKAIKISDKEARKQYDQNVSQYVQPESREVAHILVKTAAEANKIYNQVKGGDKKLFAKLAKSKSQDPSSAQNGGTLTVNRGQTVPEFDKTAFSLKVGETSKPVKTQFGYHVIQARGATKPKKKQSFDEVKDQIKSQLQQQDRSTRMTDWRTDLRKKAEKDVECKKGYVWTQTVKTKKTDTSSTTPPKDATPPSTKKKASTTKKK